MLKPHPSYVEIEAAIAEAVRRLSPPSTILTLCSIANHKRVAALHGELAAIEAAMEEQRVKRNAAARLLVALGGKISPRPPAAENTVSFPVFQRTAVS